MYIVVTLCLLFLFMSISYAREYAQIGNWVSLGFSVISLVLSIVCGVLALAIVTNPDKKDRRR